MKNGDFNLAPPRWLHLGRQNSAPREGIHVTDLINCPRKKAFSAMGIDINPMELSSRLYGTAVHKMLASVKDGAESDVEVRGRLGGVEVVGSIDELRGTVVLDYKFMNSDAFGWRLKDMHKGIPIAKPEHVWQVQTYRHLLDQMGRKTTGWQLWYGANTSGKWPFWMCESGVDEVWTEDRILSFRPLDSTYTAGDILKILAAKMDVAKLPLVGATMRFPSSAKTVCDYCEYKKACDDCVPEVEW